MQSTSLLFFLHWAIYAFCMPNSIIIFSSAFSPSFSLYNTRGRTYKNKYFLQDVINNGPRKQQIFVVCASNDEKSSSEDNKAMAFLRKIGKVGGAANKDFVNAIGVDEGPAGKSAANPGMKNIRKSKGAYKECTVTGIIDDFTEPFPFTSSGTQWSGFTDHVMGGKSSGSLTREEVQGRMANVLRGKVSLENNGGFVQMATDLALNPSIRDTVDASNYDGIEIDVLYKDETKSPQSFNLHLRNSVCLRQFSSYRSTFQLENEGEWYTIRLPWSEFQGYGPGSSEIEFQESDLRRMGILAIGKEMEVFLAISGVRFYSVI